MTQTIMLKFIRKRLPESWLSHGCTLLACALVSVCGCASSGERGWIGGEYRLVNSFPPASSPPPDAGSHAETPLGSFNVTPRPRAGLLLVASSTNTPVYAAGLRPGDVLLQVDHQPINHLRAFWRQIDAREPGTSLPISAWRDGKTLDCDVTVGRETFDYEGGNVTVGLNIGDLNLWPTEENPGISLMVLGYKSESVKRAELGSVKNCYMRQTDPQYQIHDAGFHWWLPGLEIGRDKQILKQEQVSK